MGDRSPLFDALKRMADTLPMHIPGHKRNPFWGPVISEFAGSRLYDLDLTEIPGLDDLHAPHGVIAKAQELAAECFKSKHTFFLVNGASVGVITAILASCAEGDEILIPRNAHRCAYEGLVLSGARPVYFQPEYNFALSVPLNPQRRCIIELLESKHPKALIIVNPTYQGVGCDLAVIDEARKRDVITIVDEAHGSHFLFDARLPCSALQKLADVVVHSTHKTLGSLTQTGFLHLTGERLDFSHVGNVLSLLQSTSPSYVLMASLDAMRSDLAEQGSIIVGRCVDRALELRAGIEYIEGFSCVKLYNGNGSDPTKILLQSSLMNGYELGETLRRDYGIYPEMEEMSYVLIMITVGDTPESVKRLLAALKNISLKGPGAKKTIPGILNANEEVFSTVPELVLTPRQAFYSPKRKCRLRESIGRISGSLLVPYPPGVPLLCPGERISREVVEYLYFIKKFNVQVQGLGSSDNFELFVLEC